jgi:hypothetical protein
MPAHDEEGAGRQLGRRDAQADILVASLLEVHLLLEADLLGVRVRGRLRG